MAESQHAWTEETLQQAEQMAHALQKAHPSGRPDVMNQEELCAQALLAAVGEIRRLQEWVDRLERSADSWGIIDL